MPQSECTCVEGAETGGEHHESHCPEYPSAEENEVGFARCMHCGERFMGEEQAEVTLKADQSVYKRHLIIHQSCYDESTMEVA